MNVHFICRGNVLRSLVAEAYTKSLALEGVNVISSGTSVDWDDPKEREYFANTLALLEKHGLADYVKTKPDQIDQSRVDSNHDIIVVMNDRVLDEASMLVSFPKNVLNWGIVDIGEGHRTDDQSHERYEEEIYQEIIGKVEDLFSKIKTYDAVLVLGGGINLDGSLSESTHLQIQDAVQAFNQYSADAFIASGLYGYKDEVKPVTSEARAYVQYAQSLGIDPAKTYVEERSQETLGNILFTKMQLLIPHGWTRIVVVPQVNHSSERINYILQKILGPGYEWIVVRPGINTDEKNAVREAQSLDLTKQINDVFADGDHDAIYAGLMASHPAYGGTLRTVDELREILG